LSARSQSRRVSQETSQKRQKASELHRERPADAEMDGDRRQRAVAPVGARLPADPPDVAPAGFASRRRVHGSCPTCAAIAIARNRLPAPTMRWSIPGKNSVVSAFFRCPKRPGRGRRHDVLFDAPQAWDVAGGEAGRQPLFSRLVVREPEMHDPVPVDGVR